MRSLEELRTNRDLYRFVAQLGRRHSATSRSLEHYLTALWHLAKSHRAATGLSLGRFAALLDEAFTTEAPPAPLPRELSLEVSGPEGFLRWERTIAAQIADLREMREAGTLADEQRSFGVNAPSGARWYNFDPVTFLECAVEGSVGGWQPGDDIGRAHVPGKVAVPDAAGGVTAIEPVELDELDEPLHELAELRWEGLVEFLWAGQSYE